jgi:hypothetical protein
LIALSVAVLAIAAAIFAFVALSASGNSPMQPLGGMEGMMMQGGRMQMQQAAEDIMIFLESEGEVPTGNQTEVLLKVVDKQTNTTMQGADVIIGIEKGLPITTMDMIGGMFSADERRDGTYAFPFTPESKGYYTVHTHVIPPGEQMHSMMENHADIVITAE